MPRRSKDRADARHEQRKRAQSTATPYSRPAPSIEGAKPDQLDADLRYEGERQERLIDAAVEETFPASDPIAPSRVD